MARGLGAGGWGLSASSTMLLPQGRLLAGGFASDADRQKLSASCTGRWGLGRVTTLLHGVPGDGGGAFLEVEGQKDVIVDPGAVAAEKGARPQARPSLVARAPMVAPSGASNVKRPRTTFFRTAGTVITA